MKELFMAKEKECVQLKQKVSMLKKELDEANSQIVIAEYNREKDLEEQKLRFDQETQTLQQLIQETCDESTLAHNEIKKLQDENERIKQELISLKESYVQQQQVIMKLVYKQLKFN